MAWSKSGLKQSIPWKATWRDIEQGRLYFGGIAFSTTETLGNDLPYMLCVVNVNMNIHTSLSITTFLGGTYLIGESSSGCSLMLNHRPLRSLKLYL